MGCVSNNYCDHNIEITQNFTEFTKKRNQKEKLDTLHEPGEPIAGSLL